MSPPRIACGALAAALAAGACAGVARADAPAPPAAALPAPLADVAFEQRLGVQLPLDAGFLDETGRRVTLRECFAGRPTIVTLVYYECPMLCTLVLNGLSASLNAVSFDAGREFSIVTVSFDPRETPQLAAAKKHTYLERYQRPTAASGWRFLTGDSTAIARLAEAVGFRYAFDPERGQFAHASGLVIATPDGVLSKVLYGIEYAPRDLRLALVDAGGGRIGTLVDQVLLYCFHYDPETGSYGAAVLRIVRAGGVLTLAGLAIFLLRSRRRALRAVTHVS